MQVKRSFCQNAQVDGFISNWGEDWEDYSKAIVEGFCVVCLPISNQLSHVISREKIQIDDMGFLFHIDFNQTWLEIFLKLNSYDFLSLNPTLERWLKIKYQLKGRDRATHWREIAKTEAEMAATYLVSDLARDGFTSEIKRRISFMAELCQTLRHGSPF